MPAYVRPYRRLSPTAGLAALALALAACTPSAPSGAPASGAASATASATESPAPGSAAPTTTGAVPSSSDTAAGQDVAAGAPGSDRATFSAAPPEQRAASAPDAGACSMLREDAVRAALGSAAPATLTPSAGDDEPISGYAGAVQRSCTMKLGPEPRHTVSVVVAQFADAASAHAYGVVPQGLTATPVAGVGESAAFGQTTTLALASTTYYLYVGRGAQVVSYRLGQVVDSSGKVQGLDPAAAREALVRLAGAAGL